MRTSRRGFFGALACGVTLTTFRGHVATNRVGLLTLEDSRAGHCRVFLDGVDVSSYCFVADDRQGWVGLYVRDADLNLMMDQDHHRVKTRVAHGHVVITFDDDAPMFDNLQTQLNAYNAGHHLS